MNHRLAAALAALVLVLVPSAASAKGPVAATIVAADGSRLTLDSHDWAPGEPFVELLESTHALSAIFRTDPEILADAPTGELGPRFEITWDLGLVDQGEPTHLVRQDAYPYAEGGPVTFVPPGQALYGQDTTPGGWYAASSDLSGVLESLDLVATPPTARGAVTGFRAPVAAVAAIAAGLAAIGAIVTMRTRLAAR
jgi:hypothetical protein